jgi:hypothetical protein
MTDQGLIGDQRESRYSSPRRHPPILLDTAHVLLLRYAHGHYGHSAEQRVARPSRYVQRTHP